MKKILFRQTITLLLLATSVWTLNGQNIYAFAGIGVAGFSGDGGQATNAQIQSSNGIWADGLGNVYIADSGNNRIRKINPSGVITTIAGTGVAGALGDGGTATSAQLNFPGKVITDVSGNIYIADSGNNKIRKIGVSGIITTIAGTGVSGFSGDGGPATSAKLSFPGSIAIDAIGNIYVCDGPNARIRKINTSGIISTFAGNGTLGFSGDGGTATSAQINPSKIAIDNSGNLYISESGNKRIRKVNSSGIISTFAGTGVSGTTGDGGLATSAEFVGPTGITTDGSGNLYISDYPGDKIRIINSSGIINTKVGNGVSGYGGDGGPAIAAQIDGPIDVTADSNGNIFFIDAFNIRIRTVCATNCLSGINELKNNLTTNIYPNPNNGLFFIQINNEIENGTLVLINSLGHKVYEQKLLRGQNNIITHNLSSGLYNYIIFRDREKISRGKLTVE